MRVHCFLAMPEVDEVSIWNIFWRLLASRMSWQTLTNSGWMSTISPDVFARDRMYLLVYRLIMDEKRVQ